MIGSHSADSPFPAAPTPDYNPGMDIAMPTFGVTFAAFCVWLGIRILNRRERWAIWTAAIVVYSLLLYIASSGPTRMIAVHARIGNVEIPGAQVHFEERLLSLRVDDWWEKAYSPLRWLSQRPPGMVLEVYRQHFPVQTTRQP